MYHLKNKTEPQMKFVQLALLGLVSVQAIKIRSAKPEGPPPAKPEKEERPAKEEKNHGEEHDMPSAAEIIAHCDASGNGMLDEEEVHKCI